MIEESQHLHNCAHCSGTGTCNDGKDGETCAACIRKQELKVRNTIFSKPLKYYGVACGTCGGIGKTDTLTYRLNNRATPLLAMMIIGGCFALIIFFGFLKSQFLSEIITFCGTLVGAVIGHYFGKNQIVKT